MQVSSQLDTRMIWTDVDHPGTIAQTIAQSHVTVFTYGIYVIIFSLCVYVLLGRRKPGYRWHLATMSIMFSLSTAFVVLQIIIVTYWMNSGWDQEHLVAWRMVSSIIFVISNLVSDAILIYRCYVIWTTKRVLIIPAILWITTAITAFVPIPGAQDQWFFPVALCTNILVTGLTAGRIWYINRAAVKILGTRLRRKYTATVAVILESGIVYPCLALAWIITASISYHTRNSDQYRSDFANVIIMGAISQFIGIAPTLMIVRVGLGASTDNVENSIAAMIIEEDSSPTPSTIGIVVGGLLDIRGPVPRRRPLDSLEMKGRRLTDWMQETETENTRSSEDGQSA